jgi:ABC-type polysaccharide/polyol phosphate export permease
MYHFVTLFRIPIYFGLLPTLGELLIPLGISLFFLVLGWLVFTRKSDEFSYRI